MNLYLTGALEILTEKARMLNAFIPRQLPRDVDLLVDTCKRLSSERIGQIRLLTNNPQMLLPENEPERLREYKRISKEIEVIEKVGITTLNRWQDEDTLLNRIAHQLSIEIKYPLTTPIVASLSKDFYCTYPGLNLLLVPLYESKSLLYLPLLGHEFAHHLLACRNDPLVEPFLIHFCDIVENAMDYVSDGLAKSKQRHEPLLLQLYFESWHRSWFKWASEIICDLFAVFTLGVSFVWSSLHYCLQYGEDPYILISTPTSHPPFGIRIEIMIRGLRLIGLNQDADQIESFWNKYIGVSNYSPSAEYYRCFPGKLIDDIVNKSRDAVDSINCDLIVNCSEDDIRATFNESWKIFWGNSNTYLSWENKQMESLKQKFL
ncbi:hypothetical protein JW887_05470 [Candidatus Dojkabacteria bacterium]|nr:hypothetical protein [Candidatus Dojkabacteria bacterium]